MELRQLRYFVRIVETGSMGSAALDLSIGVSALSQQMTRLENELAIRLLQRTSRGVTPTSAGLAFYAQAQLALRHADDAIPVSYTHLDVYKRQAQYTQKPLVSFIGQPVVNLVELNLALDKH